MAIKVESSFVVPTRIEDAWRILTDVPRIAPCMPGAEVTEVVDEHTYKGLARVKIGPMQLVFNGEARLHDLDPVAHTSRLSARGGDNKGRGSVQSEMSFSLLPEGEQTRVTVMTDISLSGAVAQYGRGAGMIKEICNQFAAQFARNLAAQVEGGGNAIAGGAAKPVSAIGVVTGAVKAMVARKIGGGEERGEISAAGSDQKPTPPPVRSTDPSS
jgi:uncharacterized protein